MRSDTVDQCVNGFMEALDKVVLGNGKPAIPPEMRPAVEKFLRLVFKKGMFHATERIIQGEHVMAVLTDSAR